MKKVYLSKDTVVLLIIASVFVVLGSVVVYFVSTGALNLSPAPPPPNPDATRLQQVD